MKFYHGRERETWGTDIIKSFCGGERKTGDLYKTTTDLRGRDAVRAGPGEPKAHDVGGARGHGLARNGVEQVILFQQARQPGGLFFASGSTSVVLVRPCRRRQARLESSREKNAHTRSREKIEASSC